MDKTEFDDIKAIITGEVPPPREWVYEGQVLVEVREQGEATWTLAQAAEALVADPEASFATYIQAVRTGLRQTQEGFAQLLGVPVGTVRGWEQHRRAPDSAARALVRVAAKHPEVVRAAVTTA